MTLRSQECAWARWTRTRTRSVVIAAWMFVAALHRPVPLRAQQMGTINFPTSGAAAAQLDFERGVLSLHNFQYRAAAEAFQRAQAIDPRFVMAYWGEALTYTHQVWNEQDMQLARAALTRLAPTSGARLVMAPTPRERAYLVAVEALYGDGSKARRDTLYSDAMEQLWHQWPADDEAAVLYATSLFGLTQGVRDVPLYMRAGAIAQNVFRRNPQHPGAAHMIIHAFDDPVHAPLGLYAARQYSGIAANSAHAQHMTSHIFLALGLWPDVVSQNIVASGPDTSQWAAGHATHWLLYGYLQQGRRDAARALLVSLAARAEGKAQLRGYVANFRARYVLESEEWSSPEAKLLVADAGQVGEDGNSYAAFAAGYAAAMRGDRRQANEMLAWLVRDNGARARTVRVGASGSVVVPVIMELALRAVLARQDGHGDSAVALMRRAAALEDGMPAEFGPPAAVAPSHELLGAMLALAGRHGEAAGQYAKALQLQPGRSSALLGLARAERARGRTEWSLRAWRQLVDNWKDADVSIPALVEARAAAAGKVP